MRAFPLAVASLSLGALAALGSGCDKLGIPSTPSAEAEAKAVGAACRHVGRSLSDCYKGADEMPKSAIFAGWREMNDYMTDKKIDTVKPEEPPPKHVAEPTARPSEPARPPAEADHAEERPGVIPEVRPGAGARPEGRTEGRGEPRADHREARAEARPAH